MKATPVDEYLEAVRERQDEVFICPCGYASLGASRKEKHRQRCQEHLGKEDGDMEGRIDCKKCGRVCGSPAGRGMHEKHCKRDSLPEEPKTAQPPAQRQGPKRKDGCAGPSAPIRRLVKAARVLVARYEDSPVKLSQVVAGDSPMIEIALALREIPED